ncbi:Group 3 secretory phospholipase A2 [Merluccius polli]|uniref:Group 3 secretory phospholipase A2 n=1 Tax=Merluccius polli TaxID=89951 RepID=A0AA47NBD6_MERPO|nr:Group 3 secretory phospholipase A2 [Merluccius polli]
MLHQILLWTLSVVLVLSVPSGSSGAQDGVVTSTRFCPTLRSGTPMGGRATTRRLTFLQRAPQGDLLTLYRTEWTGDDRLVGCSVSTDPVVTGRYLSLCEERDTQDAAIISLDISTLLLLLRSLGDDHPCTPDEGDRQRDPSVGLTTPTSTKSGGKSRRKRTWYFPGTLWCGTGSIANEYSQLGMFESADKCCREHDHCLHTIPSFTVNYGTLNANPFTVSHCDCDHRFRQCLVGVNDTIANMVGYSFFDIFKVPCFNLIQQRQCTKMSWYGRCKASKKSLYAVFQNPSSYSTFDVTSNPAAVSSDGNKLTCTEGCPVTNPKRRPNLKRMSDPTPPRCRPRQRAAEACRKSRKQDAMASVQMQQTTSVAHSTPVTSKMPRITAQLRPTGVVSGLVVSSSKKNGTGLGVAYASLATSKAITRMTTSSTRSTTPVLHAKVFNPPVVVTTITPERHKNTQRKHRGCSTGMSVIRGSGNHPWREPCLKEKTAMPHRTATTMPLTDESGLPRQPTVEKQRPNSRGAAAASTPRETTPGIPGKIPDIKMSGILTETADAFWDSGNSPRHANKAQPSLAGAVKTLRNLSHCTVLNILDECKYRIPALEKKYGLQNMESKTIYHCDCISRLTIEIEHIQPTRTILSLLVDFVSSRCFHLPMKKCHRKRCIGYFSQAPAAFQGLKQKVEKDTAAKKAFLQDTKTDIPVRFYKRCLRTTAPRITG